MKSLNTSLKALSILSLILVSNQIDAQVGIGNPTPHASSILDLTNTSDKFLILPVAQSAPGSNTSFTAAPAGTMLYYDDNLYFKTSTGIKSITPWLYDGTAANGVYSPSGTPVSIGIQPLVSSPAVFQIANASGEVTQTTSTSILLLGSNTTGVHMLMDGDEILVKTNATTAGMLKLQEDGGTVEVRSGADAAETTVFTAHGSVDAKGKLKENGKDLIPQGAIMIWTGSTAPAGWALCDGGSYPKEDGTGNVTVPDLRERFIVGFGDNPLITGSYALNSTGGVNSVALNRNQIPSHSHSLVNGIDGCSSGTNTTGSHSHTINHDMADFAGAWAGGAYVVSNPAHRDNGDWSDTSEPAGNHSHNLTGSTGNGVSGGLNNAATGLAHENRPPFYALAFIYKL